jgi:hypothetical protein
METNHPVSRLGELHVAGDEDEGDVFLPVQAPHQRQQLVGCLAVGGAGWLVGKDQGRAVDSALAPS